MAVSQGRRHPGGMSLPTELRETLTFILAGGQGERLMPLTAKRAKPAVPFGGAYRIIDFTLSNCIHSGLRRIHVLTQYQARSLEEHIRFGWNFLPRRLCAVHQRAPAAPPEDRARGTRARPTRSTRTSTRSRTSAPKHVLILSGDHIYKMDYGRMLERAPRYQAPRRARSARCTGRRPPKPRASASSRSTRADRVRRRSRRSPRSAKEIPGQPGFCLGSMGIYIFEARGARCGACRPTPSAAPSRATTSART